MFKTYKTLIVTVSPSQMGSFHPYNLITRKMFIFLKLMLLLLSCFSRVQLCVTPQMAAHQAPPSLGFSRQEHWSGLPFPSPMHENEKWKWSRSVVSNSSRPRGLQPTRLLHLWDLPGKSTGVGYHCLLHCTELACHKDKDLSYQGAGNCLVWFFNDPSNGVSLF